MRKRSLFDSSEMGALRDLLGRHVQVLSAARGPEAGAVVTPEHFAVWRAGQWSAYRWETIQRGGWDHRSRTLMWELIDGNKDRIHLDQPEDLPPVFAGRVNASIIGARVVTMPDDLGQVQVAGRRSPAGVGDLVWTASPIGDADLNDPRAAQFVMELTAQLREEYGE